MWLIPPYSSDIVALAYHPEGLRVAWFSIDTTKKPSVFFHHTEFHSFNAGEFLQGIIHNVPAIDGIIKTFIQRHAIKKPYLACAINGPGVHEEIVRSAATSLQESDGAAQHPNMQLWDYTYLCSDGTQRRYYMCGITRQQLAQHTLIASINRVRLQLLTTHTAARLQAYAATHGAVLKTNAVPETIADLQQLTMPIGRLVELVQFKFRITEDELSALMPCIGMAFALHKDYV